MLGRLCGPERSNVPVGNFDGPRAWNLVLHWCTYGSSSWVQHRFADDGQRDEHGIGSTTRPYAAALRGSSTPAGSWIEHLFALGADIGSLDAGSLGAGALEAVLAGDSSLDDGPPGAGAPEAGLGGGGSLDDGSLGAGAPEAGVGGGLLSTGTKKHSSATARTTLACSTRYSSMLARLASVACLFLCFVGIGLLGTGPFGHQPGWASTHSGTGVCLSARSGIGPLGWASTHSGTTQHA